MTEYDGLKKPKELTLHKALKLSYLDNNKKKKKLLKNMVIGWMKIYQTTIKQLATILILINY